MSTRAIPPRLALTKDRDVPIPLAELAAVAAALQVQVNRDFAPVWHAPVAAVGAFESPDVVPVGYWQIILKQQLDDPGALGYHADVHRQPIAFVEASGGWPTTCSHEVLEMLADPWGSRLVAASMPEGRGRVLVEVCDPCEAFTYLVDGIALSDFVLPSYYGPHRWGAGVKSTPHSPLSFLHRVDVPLSIARGGYLSYEVAGVWRQLTWFGSKPATRTLGRPDDGMAPREWIDRVTREAVDYIGAAGAPGR